MFKTAIIIINYRTPWHLKKCLSSVFRNTSDFKIFLVHNDPDNDSIRLGEYFKKRYPDLIDITLNEKNLGFVGGINSVYSKTEDFEYICLLNSDVIVTKNWLYNMVRILDNDTSVVQITPDSNHYYPDNRLQRFIKVLLPNFYKYFKDYLYFLVTRFRFRSKIKNSTINNTFVPSNRFFDFCSGACNVFRRKFFDNLGYFCDPNIVHGYGDDFDLSYYLSQFGQIGTCPSSFVFHFVNVSFNRLDPNKSWAKKQLQFLNQLYVFNKWKSRLNEDIAKLNFDQILSALQSNHFSLIVQSLWLLENKKDLIDLLENKYVSSIANYLGIYV